jgi:hypothetical protein
MFKALPLLLVLAAPLFKDEVYMLRQLISTATTPKEVVATIGEPQSKNRIIVDPVRFRAGDTGIAKVHQVESWMYKARNGELHLTIDLTDSKVLRRTIRLERLEFLKRVKEGMTIEEANKALDGAEGLAPKYRALRGVSPSQQTQFLAKGVRARFEVTIHKTTKKIVKISVIQQSR